MLFRSSVVLAAAAGLVFEVLRIRSGGKFPLSPLSIGLGVILPPDSTMAMFLGAAFFTWLASRRGAGAGDGHDDHALGDIREPVCAGLIAGSALVGISDILLKVFLK